MSATILSHASALRAMRAERERRGFIGWNAVSARRQASLLARGYPQEVDLDLDRLEQLGAWRAGDGEPLQLLGSGRIPRYRDVWVEGDGVVSALPTRALLEIEPELYCVTPAVAVLQLSRRRSLGAALMLAMELMGSYALSSRATAPIEAGLPWDEAGPSLEGDPHPAIWELEDVGLAPAVRYGCEEALSPRALSALARGTKSSDARRFRDAARYALPSSRSPMESLGFAMLNLPMRCGGFAFHSLGKGMVLNRRLDFKAEAALVSKMGYAIPDATIPQARTLIEYNGGQHDETRIRDENRNTGLAVMGYQVLVLNKTQLRGVSALEEIARSVYGRAGKRFRIQVDGYRLRQIALLNDLRRGCGLRPV